jgi:heptosyltransferase-2
MSEIKRILIANIFGIGDVLFTAPLVENLVKSIKGASIDYLCNARTRDIAESIPGVGGIFVYEKDDLLRLWNRSKMRCIEAIYGLFSSVRRNRYDAVFDFTLSREFGLFFMLSGIPRRIGLDYRKRGLFLTHKLPLKGFEDRHVIEHYLDLLRFLEVPVSVTEMRLVPDERSLDWASNYLKDKGVESGPLVAIVPGGGASWGERAPRKRWESAGFLSVADTLAGQGIKVALFGDPSESGLCREISEKMTQRPFAVENALTLKQYIALLSKFDLVVCNDGGPLHMAVALGVRTVSIFGPVDEKVYGPYPQADRHRTITAKEIPCRPCYSRFKLPECEEEMRCLTNIDPEEVAGACLEMLGDKVNQ